MSSSPPPPLPSPHPLFLFLFSCLSSSLLPPWSSLPPLSLPLPLSLSLSFLFSVTLPLSLSLTISNVLTLFSGGWLHSHLRSVCWKKWQLAILDMHYASFLELMIPEGKIKRFSLPLHQFHFSEDSDCLCFADTSLSRWEFRRLDSLCREAKHG